MCESLLARPAWPFAHEDAAVRRATLIESSKSKADKRMELLDAAIQQQTMRKSCSLLVDEYEAEMASMFYETTKYGTGGPHRSGLD